jgi:arylformamidase
MLYPTSHQMGELAVMDKDWIDITIPLKVGMICYPGDLPVCTTLDQDLEKGDTYTLTSISLSAHSGTHIDAPRHFIRGATAIDSIPYSAINGRARVIGISNPESITKPELELHRILKGEIILFKTRNSNLWRSSDFCENYVYLSTEGATYLVELGVKSIGIDYLSIGGYKKNETESHQIVLGASIWIIESLDLSAIEPGHYELACLPLKLEGCEAAPARAFVRPVERV